MRDQRQVLPIRLSTSGFESSGDNVTILDRVRHRPTFFRVRETMDSYGADADRVITACEHLHFSVCIDPPEEPGIPPANSGYSADGSRTSRDGGSVKLDKLMELLIPYIENTTLVYEIYPDSIHCSLIIRMQYPRSSCSIRVVHTSNQTLFHLRCGMSRATYACPAGCGTRRGLSCPRGLA